MNLDFRDPINAETSLTSANKGLLKIEVPHWAVELRVFNNNSHPVEVGKIENNLEANSYISQTSLKPGVYQIETTLDGNTEQQDVPIVPNKVTYISTDEWDSLKLSSAAPVETTITKRKWHTSPAEKWSRKITWKKGSGDSGFYMFIRTLHPEDYKSFSEGLALLNAEGKLITDFSEGIKKDVDDGWMAFNSDLPAGGYILRRGRRGVKLRYQPIYLCKGWETQVFIVSEGYPTLSNSTVNMVRRREGFYYQDDNAIAVETILSRLKFGTDIASIIQSEQVNRLIRKKENPWLAILAAYIIILSENNLSIKENSQLDLIELFEIVKDFLLETIPDHPDVRAVLLDDNSPPEHSFYFPPMLRYGLKLVRQNATKFEQTIPLGSLTDCILDYCLEDSPWTSWRYIEKNPQFDKSVPELTGAAYEKGTSKLKNRKKKSVTNKNLIPGKYLDASIISLSPSELESDSIEEILEAVMPDFSEQTLTQVQTIAVIEKVKELAKKYSFEHLPSYESINTINFINKIIENTDLKEVSAASGIPLARMERGFELLIQQRTQSKDSIKNSMKSELLSGSEIRVLQQAIIEFALNSVKKLQNEPNESSEKINVGDYISKILVEAERLWLAIEKFEREEKNASALSGFSSVRNNVKDLFALINKLLKSAEFWLVADKNNKFLYSNKAFSALLSRNLNYELVKSEDKVKSLREKNQQDWENEFAKLSIGSNEIKDKDGTTTWSVKRIIIEEENTRNALAYINTFRNKRVSPISETSLEEIKKQCFELMEIAPNWVYSPPRRRDKYQLKLDEVVKKLKRFL